MKWKKWLVSISGIAVTAVALHFGVPAPVAIQLGNETVEQLGE